MFRYTHTHLFMLAHNQTCCTMLKHTYTHHCTRDHSHDSHEETNGRCMDLRVSCDTSRMVWIRQECQQRGRLRRPCLRSVCWELAVASRQRSGQIKAQRVSSGPKNR